MGFLVSEIIRDCNSFIDAEGSGRYEWDKDFVPAITTANRFLASLFYKLYSENKLTEEHLRELTFTEVWQTSTYSRVRLNYSEPKTLWGILEVYPIITTNPASPTKSTTGTEASYQLSANVLKRIKTAHRLTDQQWSEKEISSMMPGNSFTKCVELIIYGWTLFDNYTDTTASPAGYVFATGVPYEIEIAPAVPDSIVGIKILVDPSYVFACPNPTLHPDIEALQVLVDAALVTKNANRALAVSKMEIAESSSTNANNLNAVNAEIAAEVSDDAYSVAVGNLNAALATVCPLENKTAFENVILPYPKTLQSLFVDITIKCLNFKQDEMALTQLINYDTNSLIKLLT